MVRSDQGFSKLVQHDLNVYARPMQHIERQAFSVDQSFDTGSPCG